MKENFSQKKSSWLVFLQNFIAHQKKNPSFKGFKEQRFDIARDYARVSITMMMSKFSLVQPVRTRLLILKVSESPGTAKTLYIILQPSILQCLQDRYLSRCSFLGYPDVRGQPCTYEKGPSIGSKVYIYEYVSVSTV